VVDCCGNHVYARAQARNLLIAYDAIGTLCEQLDGEMQQGDIASALLPPLVWMRARASLASHATTRRSSGGVRSLTTRLSCLLSMKCV
jgi:hypothetical protein